MHIPMRYDIADAAFTITTTRQYQSVILRFFSRLRNDEQDITIFSEFLDILKESVPDIVPFDVQVQPGWR
jgi:hypothetical protein